MRFPSLRVVAVLIVVSGLAFALWSVLVDSPYSPFYVARWEDVGSGWQREEFVSADDVNVVLYSFDPGQVDMRIENSDAPSRVKAWSGKLPSPHLLVNGFYFLEDNSPAGLLITHGDALHDQTFDLDKSGVIRLAPEFKIIDTGVEDFSEDGVQEAGQSYPFLLKHGQAAVKEDSGLTARRSFIGTDSSGKAYVGVVWRDEVSLFKLMQVLQETGIAWDNVLNLDGGPSTGIAASTDGYLETLDSAAPVPSVIVIEPKP